MYVRKIVSFVPQMSLPPIRPGTLVTISLYDGGYGYAETTNYERNGSLEVRWLYDAQDLHNIGFAFPAGYFFDTYWRTNHYETVDTRVVRNINPQVRVAPGVLQLA